MNASIAVPTATPHQNPKIEKITCSRISLLHSESVLSQYLFRRFETSSNKRRNFYAILVRSMRILKSQSGTGGNWAVQGESLKPVIPTVCGVSNPRKPDRFENVQVPAILANGAAQ